MPVIHCRPWKRAKQNTMVRFQRKKKKIPHRARSGPRCRIAPRTTYQPHATTSSNEVNHTRGKPFTQSRGWRQDFGEFGPFVFFFFREATSFVRSQKKREKKKEKEFSAEPWSRLVALHCRHNVFFRRCLGTRYEAWTRRVGSIPACFGFVRFFC